MTSNQAAIPLQRAYALCLVGWCEHVPRCDEADERYKEARRRATRYAFGDEDVASDGHIDVKDRLDKTFENMQDPVSQSIDGWTWTALRNSVRDIQRGMRTKNSVEIRDSRPAGAEDDAEAILASWRAELSSRFFSGTVACKKHPNGCASPARVAALALKMIAVEGELVAEASSVVDKESSILARERFVLGLTSPTEFTRQGERYSEQQRTAKSRLAFCSRALLLSVALSVRGEA